MILDHDFHIVLESVDFEYHESDDLESKSEWSVSFWTPLLDIKIEVRSIRSI